MKKMKLLLILIISLISFVPISIKISCKHAPFSKTSNNSHQFTPMISKSSPIIAWDSNGTPICTEYNEQCFPQIVSDGARGAIIAWEDHRSGPSIIYVQKINFKGEVQWTQNGTTWAGSPLLYDPQLASDGNGGAIITYKGPSYGIYAQRINSDGEAQWDIDGIAICTEDY